MLKPALERALPPGRSQRGKGVAAFLALAVVFAFIGIFIRFLNPYFTILQQSYLRLFAGLIVGMVAFRSHLSYRKLLRIRPREWVILTLRALFLYVLGLTCLSKAITLTYYSNVAFIDALPTTAILGFVVLREKVTLPKLACIALGILGVVLIGVRDYTHIFAWGRGEILTLFAAFFFGASYILRRFQSDVLNNQELSVIIMALGGLLVCASSVFVARDGAPEHLLSLPVLVLVLTAGAFGTASMYLTNYGFERLDASLGSVLMMLETPLTVVLAYVFFAEVPTLRVLAGGVIIVLSAYGMNRADK